MSKFGNVFPVVLLSLVSFGTSAAQPLQVERVLIRTSQPYDNVIAAVQRLGGQVKQRYKYVDAIAAEVPTAAIAQIRAVTGVISVAKDVIVRAEPVDVSTRKGVQPKAIDLAADSVTDVSGAEIGAPCRQPTNL